MKQLAFMSLLMLGAGVGATLHPFWPLLVYYFLAVLRPTFLWHWALPEGIPWSMVAGGMVGISLLVHGSRVVRRIDLNLPLGLLAFFAVWLVISNTMAMDPGASWRWTEPLLKMLAAALVATVVIDRVEHVRLLVVAMFAALGYIAWHVNSLYYFHGRLDVLQYGFGGFDNNGVALLVAAGTPMAYAMWRMPHRHAAGRWLRWSAVPVGVMMLHTLMLTYSRGSMIACVAGVGWLALWHKPRRQTAIGLAGLAVCVVVLAGPEVRDRYRSVASYDQDASAQQRIESWHAGWRMVWERPITGFGSRGTMPYLQAYAERTTTPVVHNQYLQLASDGGVPLALAFIGLVGVVLIRLHEARSTCLTLSEPGEPPARAGRELIGGAAPGVSDWPWDRMDEPTDDERRAEAGGDAGLWLGLQASLVTLLVGGLFLSIEAFELLWALLALGCVATRVATRPVGEAEPAEGTQTEAKRTRRPRPRHGPAVGSPELGASLRGASRQG